MKRILGFLGCCIALLAISQDVQCTDISGGPVWGTWTPADSPYNIFGEINVPANQTLTIESGVQVIFQGHYKFLVYGMLEAVGTVEDSITFTAADTSEGWHGLRFYDLNTQPDSSRLVYCKITYGRSSSHNSAGEDKNGGAIYCSNSGKLRIEHCLICNNRTGDIAGMAGTAGTSGVSAGDGESVVTGNGGAIYCSYSSLRIWGNHFLDNHTGGAVGGVGGEGYSECLANRGGNGGSATSGSGGTIYCDHSDPVIGTNIFNNNHTGEAHGGAGGGGGSGYTEEWFTEAVGGRGGHGAAGEAGDGAAIYLSYSNVLVCNNLFYDNSSGLGQGGCGGLGGAGANFEFPSYGYGGDGGCGGNGMGGDGGAIFSINSLPQFVSNTMKDNSPGMGAGGAGGGGGEATGQRGRHGGAGRSQEGMAIICADANPHLISNSILWGNSVRPLYGNFEVSYSCIEGSYPGVGNIDTDPLFAGSAAGDCFLSQWAAGQTVQSPCVDAANPASDLIIGTTRTDRVLDYGFLDIGFHYGGFLPEPFLSVEPDSLIFYANPGSANPDTQFVIIENPLSGSFTFQIAEEIDWLTAEPLAGGPVPPTAEIALSADITGLAPGTYEGDPTITATPAVGSPEVVHVTLQVGYPELVVEPDTLWFSAPLFGEPAPSQTFTIENAGNLPLQYSLADSLIWVEARPQMGGTVPPMDTLTVDVSTAGMSAGIHEGDLIITAPGALGSPQSVHLVFNILPEISGPVCGSLAPGVYTVTGNVEVTNGDSLIISPGTTLQFEGNYMINVFDAKFVAEGTATDSINFILAAHIAIIWQKIYMYNARPGSALGYCYISGCSQGGVNVHSGSISIHNCLFQHNYLAPDDYNYGIIYCLECEEVMIDSCTIRDCVLTNPDISGAICLRNSSAEISYCEISSNTYDVDDNTKAAGIYLDEGQYLVNHCTIADNAVTGSPYGGGLYIEDGVHTISNCVIANNSPRGIFCWGDEETIAVIYCDLHGNYSSDFSGTVPTGLGLLSSTNANGDSCDVFYNIFLDPLFVNPDSGNYNLTANSPCIDAGDPESPLDPDGTIADMGAFYFPHTAGIAASSRKFIPDHFYLEPAFPNPFNPQTTLRFGLPIGSKVKLEVFDVNGRNVGAHGCALWSGSGATPTTEAWYPAGIHELTFEGSNLPSGVYLYRLTAGNFRAVGKMVLLK